MRSNRPSLKLTLVAAFLASPAGANAATINAASPSRGDVQAAVDSAATGDTVLVPAGEATWTESVLVSAGITLQGAGSGSTVITMQGTDTLWLEVHEGADGVRITGFTANGSGEAMGIYFGTGDAGCKDFRVDHNRFIGCLGRAIELEGYSYGVIDHNEFLNHQTGTDIVVYGDDAAGWDRPIVLGTAEAVFIEDNTFTYDLCGTVDPPEHAVSSNHGARYVFRYNAITACYDAGGCGYSCCEHPCQDQINNLYIWDNYNGGTLVVPTVVGDGLVPEHIQENRDYFLYERPDYAPFTYPHPLVSGETPEEEAGAGEYGLEEPAAEIPADVSVDVAGDVPPDGLQDGGAEDSGGGGGCGCAMSG